MTQIWMAKEDLKGQGAEQILISWVRAGCLKSIFCHWRMSGDQGEHSGAVGLSAN